MKGKVAYFAVLLCGITISIAATRSDDPVAALLERLKIYTDNHPQEKVHIHLDKPYYTVGDDIWLKGYVLDASTGKTSTISHILYVDFISELDSVRRLNLPLENGIAWGNLRLPDSLQEGNYRIRAYTQWMRNTAPEFYFDKTIRIGNAWANKVFTKTSYAYTRDGEKQKVTGTIQFKDSIGQPFANKDVNFRVIVNGKTTGRGRAATDEGGQVTVNFEAIANQTGKIVATLTLDKKKVVKTIPVTAMSDYTDLQFIPEGGHLVNGLPARVAFKAVNASGCGEDVSGYIANENGIEITRFNSTWLGMGSFFFTPAVGENYTAHVKFKDGSERLIKLPPAEAQGYALAVANGPEKLTAKVFLSKELQGKGNLTLVGQHGGVVYFSSEIAADRQLATINIPTAKLPAGILQLTLFSPAASAVCERIVFVQNANNRINLEIDGLKNTYTKRENTIINVIANNTEGPDRGSFSIAVTNASVVKPDADNESNILTSLLLTSDLSGYVERPNHYFLNGDYKTRQDLDVLLLTQGWRKIDWNKLGDTPPAFAAEQSLRISGRIINNGKPVVKGKITLMGTNGGVFLAETLSDNDGRFNFDNLTYPDSTKFLIQARTIKDKKNVKIEIDQVPGQKITTNKNAADIDVNVNESIFDYIRQSNRFFQEQVSKGLMPGIQIEEVVVVADRLDMRRAQAPHSVNLNGPGAADYVIVEKDLANAITLRGILAKKIPGIAFINGTVGIYKRGGIIPFSIKIDGNDVPGPEFLMMDPTEMESVEVITGMLYGAVYKTQAIILVTSRRGPPKYEWMKYAPGVTTYITKGYSYTRTFYSPKYDAANNDLRPDNRTTVYWNPQVTTDGEGKATFNFYNTDQPGNYRIVIEGIDLEGRIARTVLNYTVSNTTQGK